MMNNNMKLKIGHTESPDNLTKAHRFRLTFSHSGILPQLIMFTKSDTASANTTVHIWLFGNRMA